MSTQGQDSSSVMLVSMGAFYVARQYSDGMGGKYIGNSGVVTDPHKLDQLKKFADSQDAENQGYKVMSVF